MELSGPSTQKVDALVNNEWKSVHDLRHFRVAGERDPAGFRDDARCKLGPTRPANQLQLGLRISFGSLSLKIGRSRANICREARSSMLLPQIMWLFAIHDQELGGSEVMMRCVTAFINKLRLSHKLRTQQWISGKLKEKFFSELLLSSLSSCEVRLKKLEPRHPSY